MQDRMNARLMGVKPTGNGRRQSHAHAPMPRMTNTFMLARRQRPEEIIGSVKKGLYAAQFRRRPGRHHLGQVRVLGCTEAYLIEDGKIGAPVKGATLIGNGSDALTKVGMIGNDMALDPGIGTCGKDGQGVPGRRRPADAAHRRADGRRHGDLGFRSPPEASDRTSA